ncbi:MAG: hypothetical protein ACR2P9_08705 [Gammaproteobacteria bacterium]
MPKDGFKSVTISEEIYDKIYKQYEIDCDIYKEKGIFSFSGYVTQVLFDHKEQNNWNDIKELLIINNSLLIGMFDVMMGGDKDTAQNNLMHLKMTMFEFVKDFKGRVNN